jgi:hypothetical protein
MSSRTGNAKEFLASDRTCSLPMGAADGSTGQRTHGRRVEEGQGSLGPAPPDDSSSFGWPILCVLNTCLEDAEDLPFGGDRLPNGGYVPPPSDPLDPSTQVRTEFQGQTSPAGGVG